MKYTLLTFSTIWLLISCVAGPDDYEVTPEILKNAVKFYTANQDLVADGYQTMIVEVVLMEGTQESKRSVTLSTTLGTLGEEGKSSVTVKAVPTPKVVNNKDTVLLIASTTLKSTIKPGTALITAKAGDFTAQVPLQITLVPALPTDANFSASSTSVKAPLLSEITLTAKLTKDFGLPSVGTKVKFSITKPDGTSITSAYFRSKNESSDESGLTSAVFTISDVATYIGQAKAKVEVSGTTIVRTLDFFVIQ